MEYKIRVYEGNNLYDYKLNRRERLSVGKGEENDCHLAGIASDTQQLLFYKRNGIWFVNSKDMTIVEKEREIREGDIFIFDREKKIGVYVFADNVEAIQELDLAERTRVVLGRGQQCDIVLPGNNVSRSHALLTREGDVWTLCDNGSLNGTFVNQEKLTETRALKSGDVISIGDHAIRFKGDRLVVGSAAENEEDRHRDAGYPHWFKRAPRLVKELPRDSINIQNPPNESTKPEADWVNILTSPVVMLISLGLMAVITAASMGTMLIFTGPMALAQIALAIRNNRKQKKSYTQKENARYTKYNAYLDDLESQIQSLKRRQIQAMQQMNPSLIDCFSIVESRDVGLWCRRFQDVDFMSVRVGLGEMPISFEVKGQQNGFTIEEDLLRERAEKLVEEAQTVQNVPIVCNIFKDRLIGIVGERKSALALVKNLIIQTAVHHSYEDVKIVTVYSRQEAKEFDWVRWLPHVFDEERKGRFIGSTAQSTDSLMRSFEDVFKERSMSAGEKTVFTPFYLFVLTENSYMEHQAVWKYLLDNEQDLGVGILFVYDALQFLPKECNVIIEMREKEGVLYHKNNADKKTKFCPDTVAGDAYERTARSMAPLRLQGGNAESALPTSITFLEGYGISSPEELHVDSRWAHGRTNESMAVPIGVKVNGEEFLFDIHEKKYGPHGLVAGMTGSGKSEMVQSWILSMAIKFSPKDVAFVLIDFKGTGLLLPFMNLPHLAGTISDLDTKIQRNLIALENELSRRKALLDKYGVNNINNYLKLYYAGKTSEAMPFLFVIIDEFAEFKIQFPDFMTVIDRIFAIGRTLGVFAILLTQKPAGVVDDKMNANTRFRWCLKVASSADSKEMLHHADAAKITVPGRAYVQVGEDEVYELIQSYYSGAQYRPDIQDRSVSEQKVYVVGEQGKRTCYENEAVAKAMTGEETEISKIVDYLATVVKENDYSEADKIWMPKLSNRIYLQDILEDGAYKDGNWGADRKKGIDPVVGMIDDPASQSQYPLRFDFANDGHIAVFGAPGTGKTTLLQTVVMSLIMQYTPEEVNIYLMDFGGWSLGIFRDFPHVGGIANDNDEEKIEKLVQMLKKRLLDRKMKFSDIGVGNLPAYIEATGEKLPYIILALDNFAPVLQLYPDLDSFFIQLTREGGNYGIDLIVTAGTQMALGFKINQNIKAAVALQMTDKSDYQGIVGKTNGLEPEDMEGRGLVKQGVPLEFQAALPAKGVSESERVAQIREYGRQMKESWKGDCAPPIPIMPERIPFGSVHAKGIAIGLSSQFIEPVALPEKRLHFLPIVGVGGSGKSNMLAIIARQLLQAEEDVRVIYYSDTMQGGWQNDERVRIIHEAEELDEVIAGLVPTLQERKTQHDRDDGMSFAPVYILIDDYKKTYEEMDEKTADRLEAIIRLGQGLNVNLYIAEQTDAFCRLSEQGEGVCMRMAKENSGILLGGSMNSYSVFDSDLQSSERIRMLSDNEGYLLTNGKAICFKAMSAVE